MRRARVPLAVWAALLSAAPVLTVSGVAGAVLAADGRLDLAAGTALAAGTSLGLALSCGAVIASCRLAAVLRDLRGDAVRRLQDPSAPLGRIGSRRLAARVSSEVAELARVLDALHLRVRVGDEVGERHRREAETAGAGVFELLSGLVAAEEGARGQLAAELHDTVAQSLMIARGLLADSPHTAAQLASVRDHVEDAEEQVRAVMARTRPPALHDGDLAGAVAGLRDDLLARYGVAVSVHWPAAAYPLPLASAVTVYRFFQEALLNVVKHADVETASVVLAVHEDRVVAQVCDDGPGFDPDLVRPDRGRHVGLGLMRERARLSGGTVEVDSLYGRGTTLTLRLPRTASVPPVRQVPGPALDLTGPPPAPRPAAVP